ncbi:hypothetical protein GCM10027278_36070 [Paralcaligenes ginsengisoli]
MANHDISPGVKYSECLWGDLIVGTKEQLQALSLGVGLAFPGEPGGPKRTLNVRDPRGYKAEISNLYHEDDDLFTVHLYFPNWPKSPEPEWKPAFAGVKKCEHTWGDEYTGSAEALVAAGLVPVGHFPGQPGMRKTRVTILPDGTLPSGPPTTNPRLAKFPGARKIARASVSLYRVQIHGPEDECSRRWMASMAAKEEWRRKVRALPRPHRLEAGMTSQKQNHHARGNLRLVWSAA